MSRSFRGLQPKRKFAPALCAVLWSLLVPVAIAHAQETAETPPGVTVAPLKEAFNGRLTIEVFIDGRGPLDFFIDTAASHSAIFEKTQQALDIKPATDKQANVFTAFSEEKLQLSEPLRIDAAGRSMRDAFVVILPDWTAGGEPDGILGLDFLAPYFVMLGIEESKLTLHDERPKKWDGNWTSAAMESAALGKVGAPLYFVNLEIAGRRFLSIMDTGSISTVMNWPAALRLGLSPDAPELRRGRMRDALGKQRPVIGVKFQTVKIGSKRWRNHEIIVADLNIFEAFEREKRPTAIVGLDLVKRQDTAFDFKNERVYFKK